MLSLPTLPSIHLLRHLYVLSVLNSLCHSSLQPASTISYPLPSDPPFPLSLVCLPRPWPRYKDVVVHEALSEVAHDGILGDLRQQHHVVHAALFHIVALPVEALLAALGVEAVG